jgi:hypothetical protein
MESLWSKQLGPAIPHAETSPNNFAGPHGFPLWVGHCHFSVMLLIRSGLSILMDHPQLYFIDKRQGMLLRRCPHQRTSSYWACLAKWRLLSL